jgi:hypothetical protein
MPAQPVKACGQASAALLITLACERTLRAPMRRALKFVATFFESKVPAPTASGADVVAELGKLVGAKVRIGTDTRRIISSDVFVWFAFCAWALLLGVAASMGVVAKLGQLVGSITCRCTFPGALSPPC